MKTIYQTRLCPLVAAWLAVAGNTWAAEPAPATESAPHQEIERNVIIVRDGSGAETKTRHVEIMTNGKMASMQDIDAIVSSAMAEAFAGIPGMHARQVVKNAPYSAEVISEKIQMLPDGNQISKRTSSSTFRDSAGRTRQEVRDKKGELGSVQIHDAVDGTRYMLSPSRKTATKITIDKDLATRVEAMKDHAKLMKDKAMTFKEDGKTVVIERKPGASEEVIVKRIEVLDDVAGKPGREEVPVFRRESDGVQVFSGGGGTPLMINSDMMHSGPLGFSFQDRPWSSKASVKDLGTRDFDGVRAEGKSRSYTIPAGEIGNKNPITVSSETWYSPELQITVYSKQSDPRFGDTIYRLANIKRNEQPIALFTVPGDYTVKETPQIGFEGKAGK